MSHPAGLSLLFAKVLVKLFVALLAIVSVAELGEGYIGGDIDACPYQNFCAISPGPICLAVAGIIKDDYICQWAFFKQNPHLVNQLHDFQTPLQIALVHDRIDIAKWLVTECGADVKLNRLGTAAGPLQLTIPRGRVEMAKMLLDKGARITSTEDSRLSPLNAAVVANNLDMVKLFLDYHPHEVNVPERISNCTPLQEAAARGYVEMAEYLLQKGASVDQGSWKGPLKTRLPLYIAMKKGYSNMVQLLLRHGANVTGKLEDGQTYLHLATSLGRTDFVRWILEKNPDIDERNKDGRTALLIAAQNGYYTIAELLVSHNANVNIPTINGFTPLLSAVALNHFKLVQLLVSNSADVNAVCTLNGDTPLSVAIDADNIELAEYLVQQGADLSSIYSQALEAAAESSGQEVAEWLLEQREFTVDAGKAALSRSVKPSITDMISAKIEAVTAQAQPTVCSV